MKRWASVWGALGLMMFFAVGALTGLESVFLDSARYTALQDELNVYEDVGISREEQQLINEDLAAYLRGERDSLQRPVTLRGEKVACAFNERELAHMQDVRNLFEAGFALRRILTVAAILFLAMALWGGRCRLGRSAALSAGLFALLGAGVAALVRCLGFSRLFILFHGWVFDNDLWLLDPATDAMIRMLPEAFFRSIAAQGVVAALLFGLLFYGAAAGMMALIQRVARPKS